METQINYRLWHYDFVHYVPYTSQDGGGIEWKKVTESRYIHLPMEVSDPVEYLQMQGRDDSTDLLEYDNFTAITQ